MTCYGHFGNEEPPSDVDQLSHDDQVAITHFKDSVSRENDGRYIVQLPRREKAPPLGHSRYQAWQVVRLSDCCG